MPDTKSIGIAYRDQALENGSLAGSFSASGAVIGATTSDTLAFYGGTASGQPASASQAAIVSSAVVSISATQWGFGSSAQAQGVVNLLIEVRSALVALGLIKGSA